MSDGTSSPPEDVSPGERLPEVDTPWRRTRRELAMRWLGAASAVLFVAILTLGFVARYGAGTETGRALIVRHLEGAPLGPLGKLHIEGLTGDPWRDFRLRRLALVDPKGVWLDVRDVGVRWRPGDLLRRRVHIESLSAAGVQILRQPAPSPEPSRRPPPPSSGLPVSIRLDRVQFRLDTAPSFSVQRGLFDIGARLAVERTGGFAGAIDAQSLLRAGDGLVVRFNIGLHNRIKLDAKVEESRGGAIAGLAGLAATHAFELDAHADGSISDGRLALRALSGGKSFADAHGAWQGGGGAITARMALDASAFTAGLARSLGPELKLSAVSRPAAKGLQIVSARLSADNGVATAAGSVDPVKIAVPSGVHLSVKIGDLSRIVSTPAMGAFAADGQFTVDRRGWRWAARAGLEHLAAGGYVLARAAGPVEIGQVNRELRLKVDLQGAGGAGGGLLASALGPHPHAVLDASRLADGRILLRSVTMEGADLKLDASGDRGLFGDLSFKGDLKATNLAAARPGAHGALAARWSAAEARANQPWTFTLDAQGDQFATGFAQLDRPLGAKPHLSAEARYDHGAVTLRRTDLTGAAAKASVTGDVDAQGALKLALTWTATCPFDFGPIGVTGRTSGAGAVSGTISAPKADLNADLDTLTLPELALRGAHVSLSVLGGAPGASGQVAMTAASDYGAAHAKAGFRFAGDSVSLDDVDLAAGGVTAAGSLALRGSTLASADLAISAGGGAFLSQGRADAKLAVVDQEAGPTIDLQLNATSVVPRGGAVAINHAHLTANGPLARAAYTLTTDGVSAGFPFQLNGVGVAGRDNAETSLSFSGAGQLRHAPFRTLTPAVLSFDPQGREVKLNLAYGGGTAVVDLRQAGDALNGKASLAGVDLGSLGENVVGRVSGQAELDGEGARLDGEMNAKLEGVRSSDAPAKLALNGDVHARLSPSSLSINAIAGGLQAGDKATLDLALPVQASAAPLQFSLVHSQPVDGRFDIDAELEPIWDLFFGGDRTLGGHMVANGRIDGTLDHLRPVGHANLTAGRFEDAATGLKLRNLTADVALRDDVIDVARFNAADSKSGTLSGDGRLSLIAGGSSNLALRVNHFQLLDTDAAKATASGAISVLRAGDGRTVLSGQLNIDQADISPESARAPQGVTNMDVTEINGQGGAGQVAPGPVAHGPAASLDIGLHAARGIFVKGFGLNAEMSLNAHVGGDTSAPVLDGTARVVRGDYDLAGKRFEIDDQGVVYLASSADQIRLDLTAKLDDSSLTAMIKIGGTAAKPEITLSSVPSLPSDEILSQVLFGSSAAQLSPVQAAQLAAAVTALATGGGFDVMGGLKNFARLDRLALGGGDAATGVTVSGGKYIGSKVYVEVTGGGRQGPSAQVEVRANRSLSIISQVGGEAGAKLSVRWRMDYGKAKAVKPAARPAPAKPAGG